MGADATPQSSCCDRAARLRSIAAYRPTADRAVRGSNLQRQQGALGDSPAGVKLSCHVAAAN